MLAQLIQRCSLGHSRWPKAMVLSGPIEACQQEQNAGLGSKLSVTCNTTPVQPTVQPERLAPVSGIPYPRPDTNLACFSYSIIN